MANIKQNVADLIGNTPLLELSDLVRNQALSARLAAKLEGCNPAGSVKDRVAWSMIRDAAERGVLKQGATIIEPTSGNTGIGLAALGASLGYRVILTMPDTMSPERRTLLKAYGAEVVLTEGAQGMKGAIARAEALASEIDGAWIPGQFTNPANPAAHEATTGPEIWRDSNGQIDILVCGVGTGGTITGTGAYLRCQKPDIHIVAVEPADSPVLTEGRSGQHAIQGIGAGFVPDVLDTSIYDEVIPITNEDALAFARLVARTDGLLIGISSGAALAAAVRLAQRPEHTGKLIVVIFPDSGERYLSTALFAEPV